MPLEGKRRGQKPTKRLAPRKKTGHKGELFEVKGRPQSQNGLWIARLESAKKPGAKQNHVISVPKKCGNAVLRNRLRRVIRAYLLKWAGDRLWIRVSGGHVLTPPIKSQDWNKRLQSLLERFS